MKHTSKPDFHQLKLKFSNGNFILRDPHNQRKRGKTFINWFL